MHLPSLIAMHPAGAHNMRSCHRLVNNYDKKKKSKPVLLIHGLSTKKTLMQFDVIKAS